MTVTIEIAKHSAETYRSPTPSIQSPQQILDSLGLDFSCADDGVLQDGVPENDLDYLTPHRNGFLRTILDAYAGHHHVVLR